MRPRRSCLEPEALAGVEHLVVIGDDLAEVWAELARGSEMNGVQRPQIGRQEQSGSI
jgi:hypothetical protein